MSGSDDVASLRKAGRVDEAYALGRTLLAESPEDWSLKGAFGWVLYNKVKAVARAMKAGESTPATGSEALYRLSREYAGLDQRRPDLLFSRIVFWLLQVGDDLPWLLGFFKWAGLGSFQPEDYSPDTAEEGTAYEALAAVAAKAVGKRAAEERDPEAMTFAVSLIDEALDRGSPLQPEWLHYRKALLLARLGEHEQARELLIPVVRGKRSEFWAWHALAKVEEEQDTDGALALYAQACLSVQDPVYGLSVFSDFANQAARCGLNSLARWATDHAMKTRVDAGYRIPAELRELTEAPWYAESEAPVDPRLELADLAQGAEQVLFVGSPKTPATFLGTFRSKSGAHLAKFAVAEEHTSKEVVTSARALRGIEEYGEGDPVSVVLLEEDGRTDVGWVSRRDDGQPFDCLAQVCGVIDHQNAEKGLAKVYFGPTSHTLLHYDRFPEVRNLEPGRSVRVFVAQHEDRVTGYRFLPEATNQSTHVMQVSGLFRANAHGFGFVEDVFVPRNLAEKVRDGQQAEVVAVRKLDSKKNKMGWKAIAVTADAG